MRTRYTPLNFCSSRFSSYVFNNVGLYEPADWQHVIGIDDAAYSLQHIDNYQEGVDHCKRNGGKVFEPTKRTNDRVFKWLKEKDSSNNIGLGIIWSKNQSQFLYQSNGRNISWSNFLSSSSCRYQSCLDGAAVLMEPQNGKWIVGRRSGSYDYIFCEKTVKF